MPRTVSKAHGMVSLLHVFRMHSVSEHDTRFAYTSIPHSSWPVEQTGSRKRSSGLDSMCPHLPAAFSPMRYSYRIKTITALRKMSSGFYNCIDGCREKSKHMNWLDHPSEASSSSVSTGRKTVWPAISSGLALVRWHYKEISLTISYIPISYQKFLVKLR